MDANLPSSEGLHFQLDCFCCLAAWLLGYLAALLPYCLTAILAYWLTGFTAAMALAGLGCLGCLVSLCFVLDESSVAWLEDLRWIGRCVNSPLYPSSTTAMMHPSRLQNPCRVYAESLQTPCRMAEAMA